MARDAMKMRGDGPTIFAQVKNMVGIPEVLHVCVCGERERERERERDRE
jgi:hypothetical protein